MQQQPTADHQAEQQPAKRCEQPKQQYKHQEPIYNWFDVKEDFWKSSQSLNLGELVHDNLFGLFEAMSAIEIMDPKMDAGMVCNRKRQVLQFQEAITAGKVKIKDFSVKEVLGIIDELTSCFVTWLDGQSLVQSIFICMYCHDPYIIEDVVLKATCLAILKMVDIIRNIIMKAKVFEEEDFQPMTYNFKLANDISEHRVSGMLKEAEVDVAKKIKVLQSESIEKAGEELDLLKVLRTRLKFFQSFYASLLAFEKTESLELNKCKDHLEAAKLILNDIKATLSCGLPADKTKEYYMPGFDPLVNQRLLPPSFPRQADVFPREKAIDYLELLIGRMSALCSVMECTTLHMILEFLCDFSKNVPCVLSRSLLQSLIFHTNYKIFGKHALTDVIRDSIKLFNGSPSIADFTELTNPEAKTVVQEFLLKAVKPMSFLIEAYGHNRARQRERLAALLEELGLLQQEAYRADQSLHQMLINTGSKRQHLFCFESWVLYHALSVMIQHVFLGFELDLFNPHEFHYVYWYLDYLFAWVNNCLHRAEMLLGVQEQIIEKKLGKKEKKKRKELLTACSDQIKEHKSLRLIFNGMKDICLGNIKAYEGFDTDGKVKHPEVFFDTEKIRFEHRFVSYSYIDTRQENAYKEYKDLTALQEALSSEECYSQAMIYFQRAMESIQYIVSLDIEGERLMKVAKKNFIVMKIAASGHTMNRKYVGWDFSVHHSYPVIQFK